MIQKLKSVIILAALSLASPVALSQDSTPELDRLAEIINLPKQIRVQVELIEMSHEELTNLMTKPRAGANDQDLRDACTKLVVQNKATILETTSVIARPGQRSSTESITEFTYPTKWEPYELPNQLEVPESGDGPKALELIPQPTPTDSKPETSEPRSKSNQPSEKTVESSTSDSPPNSSTTSATKTGASG